MAFNPSGSIFSNHGMAYKEFLGSVDVVISRNIYFAPNIGFQLMNMDFLKRKNGKWVILNTSVVLGNLNYTDFKNTVDGRIYFEIDFGSWLMIGYRFAQPTYGKAYSEIGKHFFILRYYFPIFFYKEQKLNY